MKKQLLGLIALVFAVGASAFTTIRHQQTAKKFTDPLWYFTESSTTNQNDRTKYEALDGQDTLCPGNSAIRCVIEAPEYLSSGRPDLDHITSVVSFKP